MSLFYVCGNVSRTISFKTIFTCRDSVWQTFCVSKFPSGAFSLCLLNYDTSSVWAPDLSFPTWTLVILQVISPLSLPVEQHDIGEGRLKKKEEEEDSDEFTQEKEREQAEWYGASWLSVSYQRLNPDGLQTHLLFISLLSLSPPLLSLSLSSPFYTARSRQQCWAIIPPRHSL